MPSKRLSVGLLRKVYLTDVVPDQQRVPLERGRAVLDAADVVQARAKWITPCAESPRFGGERYPQKRSRSPGSCSTPSPAGSTR